MLCETISWVIPNPNLTYLFSKKVHKKPSDEIAKSTTTPTKSTVINASINFQRWRQKNTRHLRGLIHCHRVRPQKPRLNDGPQFKVPKVESGNLRLMVMIPTDDLTRRHSMQHILD